MAKKAVELMPEQSDHWNTLGAAYYYDGHWDAAIEALRNWADEAAGTVASLQQARTRAHELRLIREAVAAALGPELFEEQYADVFSGNETWNAIPVAGGEPALEVANGEDLLDEALAALLARYRAAQIDAAYTAYDAHPIDEPDEWGDLASFREAAGLS